MNNRNQPFDHPGLKAGVCSGLILSIVPYPALKDRGLARPKYQNLKVVAVIIAIFLFTAGCAKKETPPPKEAKRLEASNAAATDNTVTQKVLAFNLEGLNDKGAKQWEISGESAEAVSETEVKLANIVAKSYGEGSEATIRAEKGIYDKAKNNVRLEDNVKATIENTSSGAEGYLGLSAPGLDGGAADGAKDEKKKTRTVITCDGEVEFQYENNLAYFNKNVKVSSDYGQIDADKMTVDLDPKTKNVKDIVAEGSVKITRGENVSFCEKATYWEAEKKVVLTGRPKLVFYQEGDVQKQFLE